MKNFKRWFATSVALIVISGGYLPAQDWPQWRGPERDGKLSGFTAPAAWPANLTQKWQVKIGQSDASPVLVGENLYVFFRQGTDEVVRCLEAASGKTLWEAQYPAGRVVAGPPANNGHLGPRGTPAVADGKICTLGVGSVLSCFDAAKGTLLWRKQSAADYGVASINTDCNMSPLIVDGLCIVHVGDGSAGAVIALELADGKPRWTWKTKGVTSSSPVVMTADSPGADDLKRLAEVTNSAPVAMNAKGNKQLVVITGKDKQSGTLAGLSLASGSLLWQTDASAGDSTTPIVDGSTVICAGQGKGLFAVKIGSQEKDMPYGMVDYGSHIGPARMEVFTATPLWTNKTAGARFATPVLKDGLLYGYNGSFFCVNAKTGETLWTDAAKRGQSVSMLNAGSVILSLTVKGELIAFTPSNAKYTQLALIKVAGAETWAHPVVAGNRIFVKDTQAVTMWALDH